MKLMLALTLALVVMACSSGPEIPTQLETREWFVGVMSQQGSILRQCTQNDAWRNRPRTEEDRQQYLAVMEVVQTMGQAAVDRGVAVKNSFGEYLMDFEEDISSDTWREIWPHVEAYKVVAERYVEDFRQDAVDAGCIEDK